MSERVHGDESVESVHEWARACLHIGHSEVGSLGSPSGATGATAATTAQPTILAAQFRAGINHLRSLELQGQRETAGEVLAKETVWWKQICLRLRISGGKGTAPRYHLLL